MNSFVKFSLLKGTPAAGAKTTYGKMYVQNIVLEALGEGEYISGRFEISKTNENWYDSYSAVVTANASNKVTLNCVTSDYPDGVEVNSSTAVDFYIATAFGTYDSGISVTITVANENGSFGVVSKTIAGDGTAAVTLDRNTMVRMPSLTLNPSDLTVTTYTLVTDASQIADGTYYLAAKRNASYHLWTGGIKSNDCVTAEYTYDATKKTLSGEGAAEITFTKLSDKCFNVAFGTKFLLTSSYGNRKLTLGTKADGWAFDNAPDTDKLKGRGMSMKYNGKDLGVYLQSASATGNYLRSYKDFYTDNNGVYLFKKDE